MSKVAAIYHIVFATKRREDTITNQRREDLYRFIWHEIEKHECRLIRIGGTANHLHILIMLHPSVSLSTLVGNIKSRSSGWICKDAVFPDFKGWCAEYFACTVTPGDMSGLIEYIKSQQEHHKSCSLEDESCRMYAAAGLRYNENELT